MAASIGVRIYRLEIRQRGTLNRLPFTSPLIARQPKEFVEAFMQERAAHTQDDEAERSWYFEPRPSNDQASRGYVRYGTYGFESNLVDQKTRKSNYKRKVTDVEEIPLYYEFYFPAKKPFGFIVFQSFQGRSCIQLVMTAMKEAFERESRDCVLRYVKLMPSDGDGSAFGSAPVKRVRLIRRMADSDIAGQYLNVDAEEPIDIELSLCARRNRKLCDLGSLLGKMPSDQTGVIEYDGIEYDEAVAEIKVGGRLRRVGVFGPGGDFGVIDLTDAVERGMDGHPTFDSMQRETQVLLQEFYAVTK